MALVLKMDNNRATNKEMFVTLSSQNDSTSRSNRQTAVSVLTAIQVVKMINQKKTLRVKQQEGKNIWVHSCHNIVQILSLSLLIKTNKLVKKKCDAVQDQKWLIDRQPGHSGHCWFVWDPLWGALVLLHAVPAIDLIKCPYARLPSDQTQGSERQSQGWQGQRPHLAFSLLDGDQLPHSWLTGGLSRCCVSPAGKSWLMKSQLSQTEENETWLILQELY